MFEGVRSKLTRLAALLDSVDTFLARSLNAAERILLRIGFFVAFLYGLWAFLTAHCR